MGDDAAGERQVSAAPAVGRSLAEFQFQRWTERPIVVAAGDNDADGVSGRPILEKGHADDFDVVVSSKGDGVGDLRGGRARSAVVDEVLTSGVRRKARACLRLISDVELQSCVVFPRQQVR